MITHVSVRNYKSIASAEVELGPLTVLVGPNGAGKSNFIDALRFVSDRLIGGPAQALADRNGFDSVRRVTPRRHNADMTIALQTDIHGLEGEVALVLGGNDEGYKVKSERYSVEDKEWEVAQRVFQKDEYTQVSGRTYKLAAGPLVQGDDQLESLETLLSFLMDAAYYSVFPDLLRRPTRSLPSNRFPRDGSDLSNVLWHLSKTSEERFGQLVTSLSKQIPDITGLEVKHIEGWLFVKIKHQSGKQTITLDLSQESQGTLRLLAMLTALYQDPSPSLITLEEPELGIHPGALPALYEIIKEASQRSQILITTHSPDLMSLCDPGELRVVEKVDGATVIEPLGERQIGIINDLLFSTSDLLRIEGLHRQSSAG